MINLSQWLRTLLKGTVLAAASIVCLAALWALLDFVTSTEIQNRVARTLGSVKPPNPDQNAAWNELARNDHWAVAGWVLECTKYKEVKYLPPFRRPAFDPTNRDMDERTSYPPQATDLSREENAILQLSTQIGNERIRQRDKAQRAYHSSQIATLVVIFLGLVTTILISLSSSGLFQANPALSGTLKTLAIVFPAVGTAAAAIVAFYGPEAEWNQASRSFTSLNQLHAYIAVGVGKLDCVETANNADDQMLRLASLRQQLDDWTKRFIDIQTATSAQGQTNSSQSR